MSPFEIRSTYSAETFNGLITLSRARLKPSITLRKSPSCLAASKAGLIGLTKSLARELASRTITVNAVAPGYIETAMTAVLNDEQRTAMTSQIPLARAGTDRDIAAAVAFLASEEAGYITGHTLDVNGGMYMG